MSLEHKFLTNSGRTVRIYHPTIYRDIGEAVRLETSCKLDFYNYYWFKNDEQINSERGYSLEYYCIQRNTYGTYVCRYQDTNGTLYLEEFQLMPYPEGLHPAHITPYCQSRLHSPQIEPHISVRKLSLYPVTNPSRDTQTPIKQHPDTIEPHISVRKLSLYPITNPSRDTQTPIKQHPDTIEPHISVQQERMCVPIPASCVREGSAPQAIPSYYSSGAPHRDELHSSGSQLFPQRIVIQHSLQIEAHPTSQRGICLQTPVSAGIIHTPVPCSTVKE